MRETDSQLVRRALDGGSSSFDQLVERYRTRAFRLALGKVGVREDAIDIAQEAFVRAYMSLGSLADPERFAPWLMAIVGNLCKMRLRGKREVVVSVDLIDSTHAHAPAAESSPMRDALNVLPEGTRAAAIMFFADGLKQSEIAARLGISLAAVKGRVREARTRLQKEMIDMAPKSKRKDDLGEEFTSGLKDKLELARWYRTIAEHCGSGGDLMTGLQAIRSGGFSPSMTEATETMMEAVRAGRSVTDALVEIPALASPEASAMLHAGELFGSLHIAARIVADWLEVQGAQRRIELIFWCRTFGFLIGAGAPMMESLNYGVDIAHSKALQQATREMIRALEELGDKQPTGSPLRPVLERYPDVFPPILKLAILAGECAGRLDQALVWAADEMADDLALSIAGGILGEQRALTPRHPSLLITEEALQPQCECFLSDAAPDIRAAAVDALGRLRWEKAAPEIAARLDDDSAEVRRTAARVLAELGYKDAEEALIRRLEDADPLVRRTAIESIVKLELHGAAPALAEAIRDADHRVIMAAIESLQTLREAEVMRQKALDMLDSESWEDQKRAAYLLRYFIPAEVYQRVIASLEGKPELSLKEMNAVIALGLYGCVEARPILNRLVGDPRVSEMVARALREIGDQT